MSYEPVSDKLGFFEVEPLDRGFGHTFGNSLRRVLLSSLEGAAVTSVRVEGVQHEFTTVAGVKEDITDIILNLRELVCVLHGDVGEIEVELSATGPGKATAADISAPADLEILNPELEIANLLPDSRLEMILTIARGRGYVAAEGNKGLGTTIGVIPVDSNFSPIVRVRYEVSASRVGQRTDYDKLTLEIETDGSVDPRGALSEAAETLIGRLAIFADSTSTKLLGGRVPEEPPAGGGMHDIMIEELELGVRSYNCLKRAGIQTVGELLQRSETELAAIPNFGSKSIEEVRETLRARGLSLREA
jgi:DNA-directed RNA polymerase subunit alpha